MNNELKVEYLSEKYTLKELSVETDIDERLLYYRIRTNGLTPAMAIACGEANAFERVNLHCMSTDATLQRDKDSMHKILQQRTEEYSGSMLDVADQQAVGIVRLDEVRESLLKGLSISRNCDLKLLTHLVVKLKFDSEEAVKLIFNYEPIQGESPNRSRAKEYIKRHWDEALVADVNQRVYTWGGKLYQDLSVLSKEAHIPNLLLKYRLDNLNMTCTQAINRGGVAYDDDERNLLDKCIAAGFKLPPKVTVVDLRSPEDMADTKSRLRKARKSNVDVLSPSPRAQVQEEAKDRIRKVAVCLPMNMCEVSSGDTVRVNGAELPCADIVTGDAALVHSVDLGQVVTANGKKFLVLNRQFAELPHATKWVILVEEVRVDQWEMRITYGTLDGAVKRLVNAIGGYTVLQEDQHIKPNFEIRGADARCALEALATVIPGLHYEEVRYYEI